MPKRPIPLNRINVKKKEFSVSPNISKAAKISIQLAIVLSLLFLIITTGWRFIYKQITESYKPNSQLFSSCKDSFIQIKTTPTYGVVFKTENSVISKIYLTSPAGQTGVKSIELESKDWVVVYFSNNFNYTQVGEFLRLSKLEKGNYDYCYILEQLSLTSGIPVEYVIVDDKTEGLSSTVSIAKTQDILSSIEHKTAGSNCSLLPVKTLEDETKVTVTTYESFKEQYPTFFNISEIAQEQAFVEVYNATPIDGYASIFSRKWTMLGIDISRIGNAMHEPVGEATAIIYVKNEQQYARTMAMIKSSFETGKVAVKQGRPDTLVTTGDIVVFLLKW